MIKAKLDKIILISVIFLIASINISFSALITPKAKPKEFQSKPLLPKKDFKNKVIPPKKKIIIKKKEIINQVEKTNKDKRLTKDKKKEFSVSNQIIPLKKPEDLGFNKTESKILSKKDFQIAQKTFNLIKRKRWNSAFIELKKSKSPLLKDLVQWMYLLESGNKSTFTEYKKFIDSKKEWPRINRLRYLAEHKIDFKETRPADVINFFKNQEPLSGYGKIKLGEAYLIKGEKQIAHDLIAEGFNTANLSRDDHRYLHKKFKNILTNNDYILRAEYLAWEQDFYELQRTIKYLPKGHKELYFARFALMTRSYGVDSAIAKVPPQFKNNIGLQFDRAKWRRKRGRYDSALEIINTLPNNPAALVKPDLWFKEKFIIARNKINSKKFKEAYELLINHGVTDSALLADAEWHAGWLALKFLNKPKEASQHFKIMYDGVNYPISKSRAAYWLGEASFKLGQKQKANEWYRKAAKFNTTFYGQLAAAKIEKDNFRVKNNFTFNKGEFDKFLKKDLSKAVILLSELNLSQKSKGILRHLGSEDKTLEEQVYAGLLSQEIGRLDFAIQIAKKASYQNINLLELNYPIIETPKKVSNKNILQQEVILALIRQESEFDGRANSWAGAKGLMQIMPATGQLVAKQAGLRYSRSKLTENEFFNLQIGSFYISNLTENLSGAKYMAFAAYNAGPHRVQRWIRRFGDPRKGEIDPVDWIELIPFNETRNYVQRVIENIQVYKYVINKKTVANDIEKILF